MKKAEKTKTINIVLITVIVSILLIIVYYPLPYCSSDKRNNCRPCPEGAVCKDMKAYCEPGYVVVNDKCIRDRNSERKIEMMRKKIEQVLAERKGDYLCSNYSSNGVMHPFVSKREFEELFKFELNKAMKNRISDSSSSELKIALKEALVGVTHYVVKVRGKVTTGATTYPINADDFEVVSSKDSSDSMYPSDTALNMVVSPSLDDYYYSGDAVSFSNYCRFRLAIENNKMMLKTYAFYFLLSVTIILGILWSVYGWIEVKDMKKEVGNILIESLSKESGAVSVKDVYKQMMKKGKRPLLTFLYWRYVEYAMKWNRNVCILSKAGSSEKYWKWCGNNRMIIPTFRRPYLNESINQDSDTSTLSFTKKRS